jgi:hypothetical protein
MSQCALTHIAPDVRADQVNAHFFLHTSGNKGTIYKLNGFLMWYGHVCCAEPLVTRLY